jgi:hypothetical protein
MRRIGKCLAGLGRAVEYLTRSGYIPYTCLLFNHDTIVSYHFFCLTHDLVEYLLSKPETKLIDRTIRLGKLATPAKFDLDQEALRPSFLITIKGVNATSCGETMGIQVVYSACGYGTGEHDSRQ